MYFSFQRTYEELKQYSSNAVQVCRLSFQRTYEELKLWSANSSAPPSPGFQRTYEELKHIEELFNNAIATRVFSVPMRNWNSGNCLITSRQSPFSAYLWGIETCETGHQAGGTGAFSAYLWGIETYQSFGKVFSRQPVFSVPMRNWNAAMRWCRQDSEGFSAYLWGIETCDPAGKPPGKRFGFQRTYEELKLHDKWPPPDKAAPVFSVPMRNWNFCPPFFWCLRSLFSAYLWGIET